MTALDAWDFAVLSLALDMLSHHTDVELASVQVRYNTRRRFAMLAMRRQIIEVRAKLVAMQST